MNQSRKKERYSAGVNWKVVVVVVVKEQFVEFATASGMQANSSHDKYSFRGFFNFLAINSA
jgi:hypothetical protein